LRQGCQRLDRIQHRGKKRPTLMTPGREAVEHGFRVGMTIRRSGHGGRETSSPPIHAARSLRLCGESPLRKWRERVGNTRGAGARSSIGWQTSVGRIARLLRREVARPVGDKRALARRKSVAPPDAGARMGRRRNGARVRGFLKRLRVHGLQVSAWRFSIRRKAFSGRCPSSPQRRDEAEVLWLVGSTPRRHPLTARSTC